MVLEQEVVDAETHVVAVGQGHGLVYVDLRRVGPVQLEVGLYEGYQQGLLVVGMDAEHVVFGFLQQREGFEGALAGHVEHGQLVFALHLNVLRESGMRRQGGSAAEVLHAVLPTAVEGVLVHVRVVEAAHVRVCQGEAGGVAATVRQLQEAAGCFGGFRFQLCAPAVETEEHLPATHLHARVAALQGCLHGLRIGLLRLFHLALPLQAAGAEQEGFHLFRGRAVLLQIADKGHYQRVAHGLVVLDGCEPGLRQLVEGALVAVIGRHEAAEGVEQARAFFLAAVVRGDDEVEPGLPPGHHGIVCVAARGEKGTACREA